MIKFLPSYVGSKAYWIDSLQKYRNMDFVELFAGSAVLSANLAKTAILNDLDINIYKVLSSFDELIVPEVFNIEDYFNARTNMDWWRYLFCLQKMSFSGVFRYSKNGYNVPIKKNLKEIKIQHDYKLALERWRELSPIVYNKTYMEVPYQLLIDKVVILDPPYETSQASYNSNSFDYHQYWEFVRFLMNYAKVVIIFDKKENLPFMETKERIMVVNGKHKKNTEGMFIFEKSLEIGKIGEAEFLKEYPSLTRLSGFAADFKTKNNKTVELKTDLYDMEKTKNFFIERYSDSERLTPGGPWRSLGQSDYFVYYFIKNNNISTFKTEDLVSKLEVITKDLPLISVPNKGYITKGYKINRDLLDDIKLNNNILDEV